MIDQTVVVGAVVSYFDRTVSVREMVIPGRTNSDIIV